MYDEKIIRKPIKILLENVFEFTKVLYVSTLVICVFQYLVLSSYFVAYSIKISDISIGLIISTSMDVSQCYKLTSATKYVNEHTPIALRKSFFYDDIVWKFSRKKNRSLSCRGSKTVMRKRVKF